MTVLSRRVNKYERWVQEKLDEDRGAPSLTVVETMAEALSVPPSALIDEHFDPRNYPFPQYKPRKIERLDKRTEIPGWDEEIIGGGE